ncbi:hypothetical protein [Microcoleus sp. B3-D7]|uniref:hypothetical protein n=1 Tax=Microcoleus sp. B3-D7 TaxID=2818659 RepID=UPI002FD6FE2D
MSGKRPAHSGNPDWGRATQLPSPPIAPIEALLWKGLSLEIFKASRLTAGDRKRRDGLPPRKLRLLTLPVDISQNSQSLSGKGFANYNSSQKSLLSNTG